MFTLILLLAVSAPDTDKPDSEALAKQVRELVRQLDDQQLSKRDAAEQALIKLGADVLPLLQPQPNATAEVKQRISRIRQTLQTEKVSQSAEAGTVTLSDELPLSKIFDTISRQTGNRLIDYRRQFGEEVIDPEIKVDFKDTPFWTALDKVLDEAELTLYGYAGEIGCFAVSRPPGALPRGQRGSVVGPFRVAATRWEAAKDLNLAEGASLKLFTEIAWEPRLQPIAITQSFEDLKVTTPDGQDLQVSAAEAEPEVSVAGDSSSADMTLAFDAPPRSVEKIASLKGRLNVLLPGPIESFRFTELPVTKNNQPAKKVEQRKAGVVVAIDQVRKNNELWEVRMRIKFDKPANALESHRTWILNNDAYLVDANKKRVSYAGYEQTDQAADEIGVAYVFDLPKGPTGTTFVYKTATAILEVPVDYELKDVPLP